MPHKKARPARETRGAAKRSGGPAALRGRPGPRAQQIAPYRRSGPRRALPVASVPSPLIGTKERFSTRNVLSKSFQFLLAVAPANPSLRRHGNQRITHNAKTPFTAALAAA